MEDGGVDHVPQLTSHSRSDAFTDRRSNYGTIPAGSHEQARSGLKDLAAKYVALNKLIDAQLARLS